MHYINFQKIISYNCPLNLIVTQRGYGKSFSAKEYVINQFKKHGNKFIYLRRYENELKQVFEKTSQKQGENEKEFFEEELKQKFEGIELRAENRKFYYNDKCFGYAKRLTEAQDLKSSLYQDVTTIIFDEYPIEKNKGRMYLPNEGMIIMGILDSILRNRSKKIKIFILGNAVDDIEYSPLFTFFNLHLPYNKDFKKFKDDLILLYYPNDEQFQKERAETLLVNLPNGTDYERYALKNQILSKNKNFIGKKTGSSRFSFSFIHEGMTFGVWNDFNERKNIC